MIHLKCDTCHQRVFSKSGFWQHHTHDDSHEPTADGRSVLRELCQQAIDVQDACNLGAVAGGLHDLVNDLRGLGTENTATLNQHPLVRLWVNKLVSLSIPGAETRLYDEFAKDYDWARAARKKAA